MSTLKKSIVAIVAVAFVLAASSCNKHTCPTYSQAETTKEVKA